MMEETIFANIVLGLIYFKSEYFSFFRIYYISKTFGILIVTKYRENIFLFLNRAEKCFQKFLHKI